MRATQEEVLVVHPLDELIKVHVAPVMKAAGFVRQGRVFRLRAENGDYALLEVPMGPRLGDGRVWFVALPGIVPIPLAEWRSRSRGGLGGRLPGTEHMARFRPVTPPARFWRGIDSPPEDRRWSFDPVSELDECGEALAGLLRAETVPLLQRLVVRANLLNEFRSQPSGAGTRVWAMSQLERNEIVLMVDEGPVEEVERLLPLVEELAPGDNFREWVGEQLRLRAAREGV
jgi:hypothetical protein